MIKRFIPLIFVVAACGSGEKTPFCKCMEAGDELNKFSAKILEKDKIDAATQTKMLELKKAKEKACEKYELMSGPEMLELKRECAGMEDESKMPN